MSQFDGITGGGSNGYNALKSGNRKPLRNTTGVSEFSLPESSRKKAIANTRDLRRNFSVAAWGIRKHLDYVSEFNFKCNSEDEQLRNHVNGLVKKWSQRGNFDQSGRFTLKKAVRLLESSRFVDGDIFGYKLNNGRMQFIEADRVKNLSKPSEKMPKHKTWLQGLLINNKKQSIEKIRVGQRVGQQIKFLADVDYRNIIPLSYVERFDQWRGISPLLSGMQIFQDQAEASEYALAKLKISQLLGVAFHREGNDPIGSLTNGGQSLSDIVDPEDITEDGYAVDLGQGTFQIDLDPGDKVDLLESQNPSTQAQDYMSAMIDMALKTLDFPVSFYDGSKTNFAGQRGDNISYEKSTESKKEDLREWLNHWFNWKIKLEILNGDTYLAQNRELITHEWVSSGFQWWDTSKQAIGASYMMAMNLTSPQRECKKMGLDLEEMIKENAEARRLAKEIENGFFMLPKVEKDDGDSPEEMPEQEDRK